MVRVNGPSSDYSYGPELIAGPNLVDPQGGNFIDDCVSPAESRACERVSETRFEKFENRVTLWSIEVACHYNRNVQLVIEELTGHSLKHLAAGLPICCLSSPAIGRPEIHS